MTDDRASSYYGFSDLNGFKDFVGYVRLCAPDIFPVDEWLTSDEQMDLDRAFEGLDYGFKLLLREGFDPEFIAKLVAISFESLQHFKSGNESSGHRCLKELDTLLGALPPS